MENPKLNKKQLQQAGIFLNKIRLEINKLAHNDQKLIFAFRKKIRKELTYDERSKPSVRKKLKMLMRAKQKGICTICKKCLPSKYAVLDRTEAIKGCVEKNVRLICPNCDRKTQEKRGYKEPK
jgi:UTP:GlnB (protein PII) uridylyltransferase